MSAAGKRNNYLVQGSILAIASVMVRLIGLLYRIPMTNIIGEEGAGYYSIAYNIYNLALIISSYSLPLAVSRLVAARSAKKEYRNAYKIFLGAMGIAIFSGTIFSCAVYFGADLLAKLYYIPQAAIPLRILAPTIFIFSVLGVFRGYFQGKNTMIPTALSQILEQVVNAVVSVVASYYFMKQHSASMDIAAYGAAGGTLGTCLGAFTALLFLLFVFSVYYPTIKRQRRRDRSRKREDFKTIYKALFITIIPVVLSQTVYQLSDPIDNILFSVIMGGKGISIADKSTLLGVYSNKYKLLVMVPISIASAFGVSIIPSIANAFSRDAIGEVKRKVYATIKINMIIAIPAAVGLGVLAGPIINLLFPNSHSTAIQLMQAGSVAVVFFALSTVSNAVLQGINRMKTPVIHSFISLVLHVVIVYVCLEFFQLSTYGLVIGNISFAFVVCVLNWISIGRILKYKQEVIKTFFVPAISAAIMGAAVWFIYGGLYKVIKSNAISTVASILLGASIYFIFLLLLKGLTEEELYGIPFGRRIAKVLKRLRLI